MIPLFLTGLLAGALTTLTGMGGGFVLTLALFATLPPPEALAVTGPALLIANLHRLRMYGAHVDWPTAWRFAAGAMPAALVGGLVVTYVPASWVHGAAVAMAALAAVRILFGVTWSPPPNAVVPGGALVGLAAATTGAGGLIGGPMLMSVGLSGPAYVSTMAVAASSIHVARLGGYAASGFLTLPLLGYGVAMAAVLAMGNVLGDKIRTVTPTLWVPRIEIGTAGLMLGLAMLGAA